jgi:hypothetical protein
MNYGPQRPDPFADEETEQNRDEEDSIENEDKEFV